MSLNERTEMPARAVERVVPATETMEGAGFPVKRPFPTQAMMDFDPFMLLDEVGPIVWPPGQAQGAPDHPHRGFETITYILAGEKLHEDSLGKTQAIGPGDVQWMTAGSGIVHSELPTPAHKARGGLTHSFQIWVNLPAADKWAQPGYQYLPKDGIPSAQSADGLARVTVLAGEALGVSARIDTYTPVALHDWTVAPGGAARTDLPEDFNAAVYVFAGAVNVGTPAKQVAAGQFAVLGPGRAVDLAAVDSATEDARFLLLGGRPLNEPVARYGPFVMNTREEIHQAVMDFQSGRMGTIVR
jgi:redox-sensitive bicupin YhaK (pirin superfamily)